MIDRLKCAQFETRSNNHWGSRKRTTPTLSSGRPPTHAWSAAEDLTTVEEQEAKPSLDESVVNVKVLRVRNRKYVRTALGFGAIAKDHDEDLTKNASLRFNQSADLSTYPRKISVRTIQATAELTGGEAKHDDATYVTLCSLSLWQIFTRILQAGPVAALKKPDCSPKVIVRSPRYRFGGGTDGPAQTVRPRRMKKWLQQPLRRQIEGHSVTVPST